MREIDCALDGALRLTEGAVRIEDTKHKGEPDSKVVLGKPEQALTKERVLEARLAYRGTEIFGTVLNSGVYVNAAVLGEKPCEASGKGRQIHLATPRAGRVSEEWQEPLSDGAGGWENAVLKVDGGSWMSFEQPGQRHEVFYHTLTHAVCLGAEGASPIRATPAQHDG